MWDGEILQGAILGGGMVYWTERDRTGPNGMHAGPNGMRAASFGGGMPRDGTREPCRARALPQGDLRGASFDATRRYRTGAGWHAGDGGTLPGEVRRARCVCGRNGEASLHDVT